MKTAFVTGGTGFLGLNLVEQLRADGWRVVACHRATSDTRTLASLGAELVVAGLDDPAALERALPEGADAVFHVAGDISWWKPHAERLHRTNVDGTRHVVAAALARGAKRFVHTSSVAAYGLQAELSEDVPAKAAATGMAYPITKWRGELEVQSGFERGLDAVILQPGHIVGPHDTTGWGRLFRMIRDGQLPAAPPGSGSFAHVAEVARAHVRAVEHGRPGHRYILAGAQASYVELAAVVAELLGKKAPRPAPAWAIAAFARVSDVVGRIRGKEPDMTPESARMLCFDWSARVEKAERELGYRTVPLRVMLEDAHRWLAAEGLA